MAKFKVGDKVRIVADLEDYWPESIGKEGTITHIEAKREFPYNVRYGDEAGDDIFCCDAELLLLEDVEETLLASGAVVASYETFEGAVLVGGTSINDKLRQYAKQGVEVEVVVRVKGAK